MLHTILQHISHGYDEDDNKKNTEKTHKKQNQKKNQQKTKISIYID